MAGSRHEEPKKSVSLKRSLDLRLLIFYGVGTILGLGIYVLLGKVAGDAGMFTPFAFLLAAVIAGFTGVSYGELAARIPKSAGEVNYIDSAFEKRWLSMTTGWLIVLSAIISTATVVNGYVGYVQVFVSWPDWVIITAIVLLLGGIAAWGISESAVTITVITIIEIAGLLFVIAVAGNHLGDLEERWTEFFPTFRLADWEGIFIGAFLAFFAFIGFEDMVNVAEESKHPEKDMPRAIIISLVIMTIFYLVVASIAVLALTPAELDQSDAPLADILAGEGSGYEKAISFIGLIAIVNGVLVQIVMIARVLYGMAEKGMAHRLFSFVHPATRTPVWSTLIATIIILLLALSFELEDLARATNYILIVVFCLVNLSLWVIKKHNPNPKGVKTYPLFVPVAGFILSLLILIIQIIYSISNL